MQLDFGALLVTSEGNVWLFQDVQLSSIQECFQTLTFYILIFDALPPAEVSLKLSFTSIYPPADTPASLVEADFEVDASQRLHNLTLWK